ncbi:unnamed protein product [Phyllotreta striolata]|uniref:Uncharacterized protein n=1 Tax=Phyllotreta striolata TaxID=444603 RepID=A0A9N9U2B8_PHYSR|nr:unnamed protein product [Phyllotreta striolata]
MSFGFQSFMISARKRFVQLTTSPKRLFFLYGLLLDY